MAAFQMIITLPGSLFISKENIVAVKRIDYFDQGNILKEANKIVLMAWCFDPSRVFLESVNQEGRFGWQAVCNSKFYVIILTKKYNSPPQQTTFVTKTQF